jgi:hypothetical protein
MEGICFSTGFAGLWKSFYPMNTKNHGNLLRGHPFSRIVLSGAEKMTCAIS